MNNVFESFEDLEGWHEHSAKIKAAADALVEEPKDLVPSTRRHVTPFSAMWSKKYIDDSTSSSEE